MQKLSELKQALSIFLPPRDPTLYALKSVLPPALLIGGGMAGAKHILANAKSNEKDEEIDNEKNKDVLVVRIPRKTASDDGPSSVWNFGLRGSAAVLGALGGYSLVDNLIKKRRIENKEEELDRLKDEYSRLLGASMAKRSSVEPLNLPDFPAITGLCLEFLERRDGDMTKRADVVKDFIGVPIGIAALSGIMAHNWMYKKQKELEKMHVGEKPSPPKQIRFETYDPDEDPDERESDMSLKLAADQLIDMEYPHRRADVAMHKPDDLMSGLKAINAGGLRPPHEWAGFSRDILGRWKDKTFRPNTGSFINPTPLDDKNPNDITNSPGSLNWLPYFLKHFPKKANAELLAFLGPSAAMGSDTVRESEEDREKRLKKEEIEKIEKGTRSVDIAPGVQKIISGDNVVELEAQDPEAKKVLAQNASKLKQLIGAFESTAPELR